jgi:ABC-2 type transport system permease protein
MWNSTVLWLTWRQLFARRRWLIVLGFSLVPLLFSLFYLVVGDTADGASSRFFLNLQNNIVIGVLMPIHALVLGSTAFGGEVDDGTLIYLLVKPLPRWKVVVSKYAVAVASTILATAPAVLLPWLLLRDDHLTFAFARACLVGASVGAAIYCAFFMLLGLMTKRALVFGLLYVIAFESVLTRSLPGLRSLSVREFSMSVAQAVSSGVIDIPNLVPMSTVYTMGTIFFALAMITVTRKLARYEVAERL